MWNQIRITFWLILVFFPFSTQCLMNDTITIILNLIPSNWFTEDAIISMRESVKTASIWIVIQRKKSVFLGCLWNLMPTVPQSQMKFNFYVRHIDHLWDACYLRVTEKLEETIKYLKYGSRILGGRFSIFIYVRGTTKNISGLHLFCCLP